MLCGRLCLTLRSELFRAWGWTPLRWHRRKGERPQVMMLIQGEDNGSGPRQQAVSVFASDVCNALILDFLGPRICCVRLGMCGKFKEQRWGLAKYKVLDLKLTVRRRWNSGADKLLLGCECCLALSPAVPELLAHKTKFVRWYLDAPHFLGDQHDSWLEKEPGAQSYNWRQWELSF